MRAEEFPDLVEPRDLHPAVVRLVVCRSLTQSFGSGKKERFSESYLSSRKSQVEFCFFVIESWSGAGFSLMQWLKVCPIVLGCCKDGAVLVVVSMLSGGEFLVPVMVMRFRLRIETHFEWSSRDSQT